MSDTQYSTLGSEKQHQILVDFMTLFRGNERGYGIGEFSGAKQRDDDGKWTPGHVRWVWGKAEEEQYRAHLAGEVLTGIGVLCDDGKVWFTCLDVDDYDIDYGEVMGRIRSTNLPLVVFRTKSGGLRITIFFSEAIDAEDVIPRMRRLSAQLGYSGCEIFPKQTKLLVEKGDCPSWIYLPYGGTRNIFPEQGCMNDNGGLMEIAEAMIHCMRRRLTGEQFGNLFAAEKAADANGRRNDRKHPDRIFVQEGTHDDIVDMIFHDGPVCLRILARLGVGQGQQNHFLAHCATFLLKKYENWDQALSWVNLNLLKPIGDTRKLEDIIKRWPKQNYEYLCNNEPMHTYCDAHACRGKKYGVGAGNGLDYPELGMTIINRKPPIFIVSVGDSRITMESADLLNMNAFQTKFLEQRIHVPQGRKKDEHIRWINMQMDSATIVEPMNIMRTNASEIEMLTSWFNRVVPPWVKRGVSDDKKDYVRVKEEEQRVYFKWERFSDFLRRAYSEREVNTMRNFVSNRGEEHKGGGHWWRYTVSVPFSLFDEEDVERWLNPE